MRPITRTLLAIAALSTAAFVGNAAGVGYTRHAGQVPGGLVEIQIGPDGAPLAFSRDGTRYTVTLTGTLVRLRPRPVPAREKLPEGALSDAVVVDGPNGMQAWLAEPTTVYGHGVLGDAIEVSALAVRHPQGDTQYLRLPADTVFEDRYPRFADLDGDGKPEIVLVRSTVSAGAGLAAIDPGASGVAPRIVAEADPIGRPNRWLNPVGAGDVDGDGKVELLAVVTPHIGGTLTAYRMTRGKLAPVYSISGFSNHGIGTRELALSLVGDMTGDGVPDALVPDATRRAMLLVTFPNGKPFVAEIFREPDEITHRATLYDTDGDGVRELVYGLADGAIVVRRRAR